MASGQKLVVKTYGPELLEIVEVDIVLRYVIKDTKVVLSLVESVGRCVAEAKVLASWNLGLWWLPKCLTIRANLHDVHDC